MDERKTSRSRRRASRILAEKRRKGPPVSCDDESPTRERAKPPRRKKKEPLYEEDIIEGFAILSYIKYDDIEVCWTKEIDGSRRQHKSSIPENMTRALGDSLYQVKRRVESWQLRWVVNPPLSTTSRSLAPRCLRSLTQGRTRLWPGDYERGNKKYP
ncbi:hypothetical protein GE061_002527 [Apolygus lucorum]|uniref:Uncharacterized protein n=1 Tax=Apolygus lucorum TaxID=248454 RepID=A0A8S9X5D6_APOLU|nr:hypothetical protein GE061_002527 [Apolygus lucorum]